MMIQKHFVWERKINPTVPQVTANTMHRIKLIIPRMVYNPKQDILQFFIILSAKACTSSTISQKINLINIQLQYEVRDFHGSRFRGLNEFVVWSGISFHFVPPSLINLCPSISSSDPLFWRSGQEVWRELISFPNTSRDFWICTCLNTSDTSASRRSMLNILNMCNSYITPSPFLFSPLHVIPAHTYTHSSFPSLTFKMKENKFATRMCKEVCSHVQITTKGEINQIQQSKRKDGKAEWTWGKGEKFGLEIPLCGLSKAFLSFLFSIITLQKAHWVEENYGYLF